jgi:hypothetical protein
MKVYRISYDLNYEKKGPLIYGSFNMYVENIREIFDKAFDKIKENETEYEDRTFDEEGLTGFEVQFSLAKNQEWDGSQPRKMSYSLKPQKTKRKQSKQKDTPEKEKSNLKDST